MSPISHASRLAEFGSGIGTHGAVLKVDNDDKRIGIGTTNPQAMLQVGTGVSVYGNVGIVSATEVRADTLRGDGTNITGVVGVGTLNVRTKSVTTSGVSTFAGVTKVTDTTETTSTSTGAVIISGGVGIAKSLRVGTELHVGSNVTIGGTLTYEDVTNIDSVGLVTARTGVNVSGGQLQVGVAYSVGNAGVATAAGFVGPLTGNVTGNISGGTVAGSTGTFTGDVDIADKIVHTGDTNTALRFPAADTFTVETAGTERIRVTSTGELKINTGSGTEGIQFQASSGSNVNLRGVGTNYGELGFFIGNSEKLRITSTGRLGIGTEIPDSILAIEGTGSDNNTRITIKDGSGIAEVNGRYGNLILDSDRDNGVNGSVMVFKVDGGEKARVTSAGRVGINSTVPAALLDVQGDSIFNDRVYWKSSGTTKMSTLASNAGMNWQDSVKAEFGNSGDLKIYHESSINYIYGGSTNFPTVFMTNATERVRIKGDGETNIGTGSTTIAKFCLTGASNGGHQIIGQASNNVAALDVYSQHGSDGNKLSFAVSDNRTGSKSNAFVVKGSGYAGINTDNPQKFLHIVGNDGATGQTAGNSDTQLVIDNKGTNGSIIEFLNDTNGAAHLMFSDTAATNRGKITYSHSSNAMTFGTNAGTLALTLDSSQNATFAGHIVTGNSDSTIGANLLVGNASTNDASLTIGASATGNRNTYIDLIGDTTYTDYGARFIRHTGGVNANSSLYHRGTGNFNIIAQDAGAIVLKTDSTSRLTINSAGAATFTGSVSDSKGDLRNIIKVDKTSAYVIVASDAGKAIQITTGGVTVNASVMSGSEAVTIINNSGSDQTITQGSGMTMYNTADASSGNRTLAGRGMATIYYVGGDQSYISGSGLS